MKNNKIETAVHALLLINSLGLYHCSLGEQFEIHENENYYFQYVPKVPWSATSVSLSTMRASLRQMVEIEWITQLKDEVLNAVLKIN